MTLTGLDPVLAEAAGIAGRLDGGPAAGLAHELEELRRRAGEPQPRVVLVSAFSAGKTTLVQRWFGLPRLPVGRTATTAVPTRVAFGDPDRVVLRYRRAVELTPDRDAVAALTAWAGDPRAYRIAGFETSAGDPLRPGDVLDQQSGVVVRFEPRPDEHVRLSEVPADWLKARLTRPESSLALAEVACHAQHPRLNDVTIIDTPGYGAAAGHHERVTADVLRLRPEVVVVLLDARRLDEPRTHRMVADVGAQERTVVVGLTYWRSLLDGEAADRGVDPAVAREPAFHDTVLAAKHRELAGVLRAYPEVVALELGARCPPPLAGHPAALLDLAVSHALAEPRPSLAEPVADALGRLREQTHSAAIAAGRKRDRLRQAAEAVQDRRRALDAAAIAVQATVAQGAARLPAIVETEKAALQAAVGSARTRKGILGFLTDEYDQAWAAATERVRAAALAHQEGLRRHLGDVLPGLPDLWVPPAAEKDLRLRRITTMMDTGRYWTRRVSDTVLPTRLAEEPHRAARELVQVFIAGDINPVRRAVQVWLDLISGHAVAHQERLRAEQRELDAPIARAQAEAVDADRRADDLAGLHEHACRLAQE